MAHRTPVSPSTGDIHNNTSQGPTGRPLTNPGVVSMRPPGPDLFPDVPDADQGPDPVFTTSAPYVLLHRREEARATVLDLVPSLSEADVDRELAEASDAYHHGGLKGVRRVADSLARREHGSIPRGSYCVHLREKVQEFSVLEFALAVPREDPRSEQSHGTCEKTTTFSPRGARGGVGPSDTHTVKAGPDV